MFGDPQSPLDERQQLLLESEIIGPATRAFLMGGGRRTFSDAPEYTGPLIPFLLQSEVPPGFDVPHRTTRMPAIEQRRAPPMRYMDDAPPINRRSM